MINRVNFLKVSREWELENSGVGPGRWYRLICVQGEEKRNAAGGVGFCFSDWNRRSFCRKAGRW